MKDSAYHVFYMTLGPNARVVEEKGLNAQSLSDLFRAKQILVLTVHLMVE